MQRSSRSSSSRTLQFREIADVTASSCADVPSRTSLSTGGRAMSVNGLNSTYNEAQKWRLVRELQQQSSLASVDQSSPPSPRSSARRRHIYDDEQSSAFETATVTSTFSTRSWWPRRASRNQRAGRTANDDDKSVFSTRSSAFFNNLFVSRKKKQTNFKLNQERIISEFFDVQSVVSDAKLHDRLNQERVVAKFFDVQSVQTETKRSPRKRFSFFRRDQRRDERETRSVTSLGSIGIIFFSPNQMSARGPVPDDETITLASGLFSSANSVIPEESESSSNGEELIEFQYFNEDKFSPSIKSDAKSVSSSTTSLLNDMAAANTRQVLQDSIPRRPLKLPDNPERPSLADFDRWSSNSSVSSEPSVPTMAAPKQPTRRRLSNGSPARLLPPDAEESKQQVDGDDPESSVLSLISGIVADYAAAKAAHDELRGQSCPLPKPCLKKEVPPNSDRPTYPVVFDSIEIRGYSRTVGDNPACTCGPPIALDWDVCSTQLYSVDHYESSINPVKRTKKQFYLPARLRVNMLMEDWQVSEEELKRARREVTYIQYCRERSVATSRAASNAACVASNANNETIVSGSPDGPGVRRKAKITAVANPDGAHMPTARVPYRAPLQLKDEQVGENEQATLASTSNDIPPSSPVPLRKARSFSPPRVTPSMTEARQLLPCPDSSFESNEGDEPEAEAPVDQGSSDDDGDDDDCHRNKAPAEDATSKLERPEVTPELPKKQSVQKQLSCSNLSSVKVHTPLKWAQPPPQSVAAAAVATHATFELVRMSSEVFVPRRRMELLEL